MKIMEGEALGGFHNGPANSGRLISTGPAALVSVDSRALLKETLLMNIEQIEEAAQSGKPFFLKTADGDQFDVPHRDYISFPPKTFRLRNYCVVYRDNGIASILALRNVTSLNAVIDAD